MASDQTEKARGDETMQVLTAGLGVTLASKQENLPTETTGNIPGPRTHRDLLDGTEVVLRPPGPLWEEMKTMEGRPFTVLAFHSAERQWQLLPHKEWVLSL